MEAALALARTLGTPAQPGAEELERRRKEVETIYHRLDFIGFDIHEAWEAELGPTYEDYLEFAHQAQAAESVLCALYEDPLAAAMNALSSARWLTPPRVEPEDFLQAAERAMAEGDGERDGREAF